MAKVEKSNLYKWFFFYISAVFVLINLHFGVNVCALALPIQIHLLIVQNDSFVQLEWIKTQCLSTVRISLLGWGEVILALYDI